MGLNSPEFSSTTKLKASTPVFNDQASQLLNFLKSLSLERIQQIMKVSKAVAAKVIAELKTDGSYQQSPAVFSFLGDIYSGLQAQTFSLEDLAFAQKNLIILSGLYGFLKPLDLIKHYRLEPAYKLTGFSEPNLYEFWGSKIADYLPQNDFILNLSSNEYFKLIAAHLPKNLTIISPVFLSLDPKTKQPKFTAVHAKVARGAYASWAVKTKLEDPTQIKNFNLLGYIYSKELSSPGQPTFVCTEFGGKGLSLRLKSKVK